MTGRKRGNIMKKVYEVAIHLDGDTLFMAFPSIKDAWKVFYRLSRQGNKVFIGRWIGARYECLGGANGDKEPWLKKKEGYCDIRRESHKRLRNLYRLAKENEISYAVIFNLL